ncbi:hypothetical protein QQ045_005087 [Rhodiola kirilowii]
MSAVMFALALGAAGAGSMRLLLDLEVHFVVPVMVMAMAEDDVACGASGERRTSRTRSKRKVRFRRTTRPQWKQGEVREREADANK